MSQWKLSAINNLYRGNFVFVFLQKFDRFCHRIQIPLFVSESRDSESHEMDKEAVKLAVKEAGRFGVTSVHDLDGKIGVFKELLDEGELTVRVYAGEALTSSPEKLQEYKEWKQKLVDNNHMLKFGVIKGFIDGSLGSSTALLAEHYKNDPSTSGLLLMTQEELNDIVSLYDEENFQIAIHAIADKGSNVVLNAFEESLKRNGKTDARHRIEHRGPTPRIEGRPLAVLQVGIRRLDAIAGTAHPTGSDKRVAREEPILSDLLENLTL